MIEFQDGLNPQIQC